MTTTAQDKAESLITDYRALLSIPNAPLGEHKDHCAIQCAILSVDEILKAKHLGYLFTENEIYNLEQTPDDVTIHNAYYKYWQEVKQHLESKQQ